MDYLDGPLYDDPSLDPASFMPFGACEASGEDDEPPQRKLVARKSFETAQSAAQGKCPFEGKGVYFMQPFPNGRNDDFTPKSRNKVVSARYRWYSFVPVFLWEQFAPHLRFANFYFLVVCVFQAIPYVSVTEGNPTTLFPLVCVVGFEAFLTIIEDLVRVNADVASNSTPVERLVRGSKVLEQTTWANLVVGDIIKVRERGNAEEFFSKQQSKEGGKKKKKKQKSGGLSGIFPADLVLLSANASTSHEPDFCHVNTKSLDGETDNKLRRGVRFVELAMWERLRKADFVDRTDAIASGWDYEGELKAMLSELSPSQMRLECEQPNEITSSFGGQLRSTLTPAASAAERAEAAISVGDAYAEDISIDSVLLRGCMLKEAEWVYGVVVSVGTQTKANFAETGEGIMPVLKACCLAEQTKTPSVNGVINPQIMILSLVLVILCLGGAAGYAIIHLDALKNAFYLDLTPEDTEDADKQTSIWLQTIAIFFTYFLLNYQFIPISLYVTLKGVRTLQSRFMVKDPKMYDALDDEPMQVRSMELNDELGQVSHIFSDKTGTLTSNLMEFRKCIVDGRQYGRGTTDIGIANMSDEGSAGGETKAKYLSWMDEDNERPRDGLSQFVNFRDGCDDKALMHTLREDVAVVGRGASSPFVDPLNFLCGTYDERAEAAIHSGEWIYGDAHGAGEAEGGSGDESSALTVDEMSDAELMGTILPSPPAQPSAFIQAALGGGGAGSSAYEVELEASNARRAGRIRMFALHMALNHTVERKRGKQMLDGSSPDEKAFVAAAATSFGVGFECRIEGNQVSVATMPDGTEVHATLIEPLEYTSARKRMSVVVRIGPPGSQGKSRGGDGEIVLPGERLLLLCKGADSELLTRLATHRQIMQGDENHIIPVGEDEDGPVQVDQKGKVELTLEGWSAIALRSLVFAFKDLTPNGHAVSKWLETYRSAKRDPREKKKKSSGLPNRITKLENAMEQGMWLQGCAACEDKLQANVPQTLDRLMQAGLRIWMLTGDKVGTAKNIGRACSLLNKDLIPVEITEPAVLQQQLAEIAPRFGLSAETADEVALHKLKGKLAGKRLADLKSDTISAALETKAAGDKREYEALVKEYPGMALLESRLDEALAILVGLAPATALGGHDDSARINVQTALAMAQKDGAKADIALIIDEKAMDIMLIDPTLREKLLVVCNGAKTVIACRARKTQKKAMVELIKNQKTFTGVTLAIGDGANDVPMICAAHIGIGVIGKEGRQAVNASDYAIGKFRFLERLLLIHGRYNYYRQSKVMPYMFFKNVLQTLVQFYWTFAAAFSGQKVFPEVGTSIFNMILTAAPIVILATFDRDVPEKTLLKYPALYKRGIRHEFFTAWQFWQWQIEAAILAGFIVVIPCFGIMGSGMLGGHLGLWELGFIMFTAVVVLANAKVSLEISAIPWFYHVFWWGTGVVLWFAVAVATQAASWNSTLCMSPYCMLYWRGLMARMAATPAIWFSALLLGACLFIRSLFWKAIVRQLGWTTEAYHIAQEVDLLSAGQCNKVVRAGAGEVVDFGARGGDVELVGSSSSGGGGPVSADRGSIFRPPGSALETPTKEQATTVELSSRTIEEMRNAEAEHRAEHSARMANAAATPGLEDEFRRTSMI